MEDLVERVVVVVQEVPADEVVDVAVAVAIDAIAPGRQQVAAVDVVVAVVVGDRARLVGVEVDEGDQSVVVDVDQLLAGSGGNLALVDPDVLVEVGVGV